MHLHLSGIYVLEWHLHYGDQTQAWLDMYIHQHEQIPNDAPDNMQGSPTPSLSHTHMCAHIQ